METRCGSNCWWLVIAQRQSDKGCLCLESLARAANNRSTYLRFVGVLHRHLEGLVVCGWTMIEWLLCETLINTLINSNKYFICRYIHIILYLIFPNLLYSVKKDEPVRRLWFGPHPGFITIVRIFSHCSNPIWEAISSVETIICKVIKGN